MLEPWFADWAEKYTMRHFRFTKDGAETAHRVEWFRDLADIFRRWQVRKEEADTASDSIAETSDPPIGMAAHRQRLLDLIRMQRRQSPIGQAAAGCDLCDLTGWVSVPHPKSIANGAIVAKYMAVVSCSCARGQALHASHGNRNVLSLAQYELRFPEWRKMRPTPRKRPALSIVA
jgi:hypothetical protein